MIYGFLAASRSVFNNYFNTPALWFYKVILQPVWVTFYNDFLAGFFSLFDGDEHETPSKVWEREYVQQFKQFKKTHT